MDIDTKLVQGQKAHDSETGSISTPIFQSATFRHKALHESTGYDYSREKNPTRSNLEKTIALIESGSAGFAFSTGMAAVAAIFDLFSSGDHFIVGEDLYGGSYRFFEEFCRKRGLEFSYADTRNIHSIGRSVKKNTRALFIETPTNPMMRVSDISEIAKFAKTKNLLTIVDNTFLTPYFQRPLELGADIVVESGTKFLGGHNDTLCGIVAVKDKSLEESLMLIQKTTGAGLSPFDSWLMLRGIKTLAVRMEKSQKNAFEIVNFLKSNASVETVYYAGLPDHEGYAISKKQASGFGAMISFSLKDKSIVEKILSKVQVIAFAESLGGVETLITYPIVQTHSSIPKEMLDKLGLSDRLLRLSIGIESAEDLIRDLDQAIGHD